MHEHETMSYVGRCRGCRQIVAAIVDDRKNAKEVANTVKAWVLRDLIVERVTGSEVREHFSECMCQRKLL